MRDESVGDDVEGNLLLLSTKHVDTAVKNQHAFYLNNSNNTFYTNKAK